MPKLVKRPPPRALTTFGTDTLMSPTQEAGDLADNVRDIPLEEIERRPDQPRKLFDLERMEELKNSMKERGQLTPIRVYKMPAGRFVIAVGERRYRAAEELGWPTIRAEVVPFVSEVEADFDALAENEIRHDLRPIEVVWKVASLMNAGVEEDLIARRTGMSRSNLGKYVLVSRHPELMEKVEAGEISFTAAYDEAKGINKEAGERRGRKARVVPTPPDKEDGFFRSEKNQSGADVGNGDYQPASGRRSGSAVSEPGAGATTQGRDSQAGTGTPRRNTLFLFGQYMDEDQVVNTLEEVRNAFRAKEAFEFIGDAPSQVVQRMVDAARQTWQRLEELGEQ